MNGCAGTKSRRSTPPSNKAIHGQAVITTAASTTSKSASGARRANRSQYVGHALPGGRAIPRWWNRQAGPVCETCQVILIDHVLRADSGRLKPARTDPAADCFGVAFCTAGGFRHCQHRRNIRQQLGCPSRSNGAAQRAISNRQKLGGRRSGSGVCPTYDLDWTLLRREDVDPSSSVLRHTGNPKPFLGVLPTRIANVHVRRDASQTAGGSIVPMA